MPALWGCWSVNNFQPDQGKIEGLRHSLDWKSAVEYKLSGDNYCGALLHDASQFFDWKDHFYTDIQNNLSLFITGSIYNLQELTNMYNLLPQGLSTPEIIHTLYHKYSDSFFHALNGDFCLVIIDKSKKSIELVRDHLGIHPSAFYYHDHHLYFSTDSLALSRVFQDNDMVNSQYLLNQLDSAHEWDYRLLPNKRVQRLLPGHKLKIEQGVLSVTKYWEPEKIKLNRKLTKQGILDNLRIILQDSVKIRAVSHLKSAAHLSGGLDSGVVAALARKEYKNQQIFNGYSWSPLIEKGNSNLSEEINRVKKQSAYLNIETKFQHLTLDEYITYLSEWRYELFIFHELKVLEEAKKHHENLIFSGWGGDEFISINNDGINSDLFFGFQWNTFLKRYPLRHPKRLLGALYYSVFLPWIFHHPYRQGQEMKFFSKYIRKDKCPPFKNEINLAKWKSRREVHLKLLYHYHIPARTESFFTLGIRHGVSYRFPLLDKRIIENILAIPSKFMFKGKFARCILRELSADLLPEDLVWIDQKNEPELYETDKSLRILAAELALDELEEYRKVPEFEIFNFDRLEKDIHHYKLDKFTYDTDMLFLFLVVLKKRYEFIKGYKNA